MDTFCKKEIIEKDSKLYGRIRICIVDKRGLEGKWKDAGDSGRGRLARIRVGFDV